MMLNSQTVNERLREWGREYAIRSESSGEWSDEPDDKNLLYDLIRFRGRIPRGTAPCYTLNPKADEIEDIVIRLHANDERAAFCLRLHYCARGHIRDKAEDARVSIATFKTSVRIGEMYVMGALEGKRVA